MSETEVPHPDMNCYPYAKKKQYFLITIPLMGVLVLIFLYLFSFNPVLAGIYVFFYIWINIFQSYCCAYQNCPYAQSGERFCPAVAGIIPASFIARLPFIREANSKLGFEICATLGSLGLIGLVIFPTIWLFELHMIFLIMYLLVIGIYSYLFLKIVCPHCAIRGTCPGGQVSTVLFGK